MRQPGPVYIVDDDKDLSDSLKIRLEANDLEVRTFATASAFMSEQITDGGCVVLDLRLPDLNGLEVQRWLAARFEALPVIIVTAFANVSVAIQAMKLGAFDFIEKPFESEELVTAVFRALARSEKVHEVAALREEAESRLDSLTARESEVLARVFSGASSRMIAEALGISQRTVEVHRANIMRKLQVQNLAELLRLASRAGFSWSDPESSSS